MVRVHSDPPRKAETADGEFGGIAQLGEHLLCTQGVNGSIPFTSTRDLKRNQSNCGSSELKLLRFFTTASSLKI